MDANKLVAGKAIEFFSSGVSVTLAIVRGFPILVFLFMICIIFGCRPILVQHFFRSFIGQWASFIG